MAKFKDIDRRVSSTVKPKDTHPWMGINQRIESYVKSERSGFEKSIFSDDEIVGKNPCGWGGLKCIISELRGR